MPSQVLKVFSSTRKKVPEACEALFNNADVSDESNDGRRHQYSMEHFIGNKEVAAFHESVLAGLDGTEHLFPRDMVLLTSDAGCLPQRAHTDYVREAAHLRGNDEMPLGCIVALEDNTMFDVWPGAIRCYDDPGKVFEHKRIMLNAGDVLLFRGDLVHAGAPFERFNMRLHLYLDHANVERVKGETYYMHEMTWIAPRK